MGGNSFNPIVINDLRNKLFGLEDPVSYVKTMKDTQTDSYVIPASTINAKVGNATNGMVVTLGGKEWIATSLTLDNSENVVLTLYLANYLGTSQYYSTDPNDKGTNMYSRSLARNLLITNSNWSLFNTTTSGSFANRYLVQPKNIKYQQYQTQKGRENVKYQYNNPNDALGALSSGWYTGINYQPADTFGGYRYDAWGNDYIWLPSEVETGYNNYYSKGASSIWKLTNEQRANSSTTGHVWLRSGYYNYYYGAYCIANSGEYYWRNLNITEGIRPAIHFNLSAAMDTLDGVSLSNPTNVTSTYTSDVQNLKSVYDANPDSASWYNKTWYEHTNNYITVTPETELKNAGTYWVKVEIQQAWIDAVDAEVEREGTGKNWTAAQIEAAKSLRRPRLIGTPVTEDGHAESSTVKWFKFVINPKELSVNKPIYNQNTGEITAPSFANPSEFNGMSDVPTLAIRYTGKLPDGSTYDEIDLMPDKRGTYKAQAILVNSSTDKTEYEGGNYVIQNASTINCELADCQIKCNTLVRKGTHILRISSCLLFLVCR